MEDYSPYPVSVGQVIEFYDTSEIRTEKAWFFERNYHHYFYKVARIVSREGYDLVVCNVLKKKEGLAGSSYLDDSIITGYTANMSSMMLKPAQLSNRIQCHVLTKFKEE